MQEVRIGDKILFNRDGQTDGLELWLVCEGGISYPAVKKIGIDLLNTVQYNDGAPTNKTLLQHGLEKGYIRLTEYTRTNRKSDETLSEYLQEMFETNLRLIDRYYVRLKTGDVEPGEAELILADLQRIETKLTYAKNCCHWIKNEWDETKK